MYAQLTKKSNSQNTNSADKTLIADRDLGLKISELENQNTNSLNLPQIFLMLQIKTPPLVLGVTGTGGAGKSSLVDELLFSNGKKF